MYVVISIAVILLALSLLRAALFVVRVDGESMTPTYQPGERLLAVRRWVSPALRRDSVVVLKHPPVAVAGPEGTTPPLLVKRLVGLPGDDSVPPDHVYVVGDGPGSYDSVVFGAVPANLVLGRVVGTLAR